MPSWPALRGKALAFRRREGVPCSSRSSKSEILVNNCAVAYANDPAKFRCVRVVGEFSDAKARFIRRLVESTNPDLLMLPAGFARDKLLSPLQDVGYREVVYQDERFLVFARGSDDS